MSFKDMKQPELRAVADAFGVEFPPKGFIKNEDLVALLEQDGVTFEQWQRLNDESAEESAEVTNSAPEAEEKNILVKMTRANATFQDRGYVFTRTHPYQLMTEEDADFFTETYKGFRIARPAELKAYYS